MAVSAEKLIEAVRKREILYAPSRCAVVGSLTDRNVFRLSVAGYTPSLSDVIEDCDLGGCNYWLNRFIQSL